MKKILKERIHYIDVAKGIAIILVILGHMSSNIVPKNFIWWLYTFHMPLFFMLSGIVLNLDKYKSFKEFLFAKIKTLIVPYFLLNLIGWYWVTVINNSNGFLNQKTINTFIGIFVGRRKTDYYFGLYFLTTLFTSEVFIYCTNKLLKNRKIFLVFTFLISAVLGTIFIKNKFIFYWNIDLSPIAASFIIIGYALKSYKDKIQFSKYKNIFIIILMISINLVSGYCNIKNNGRLDLYHLNIGNPILYYIAAISGSFFVILLSKDVIKKSILLEYIGRNSLIYYAFQQILFIPSLQSIANTLSKSGGILTNKYLQILIVLVGTCVRCTIISEAITKCFPFMIGRFSINKKSVQILDIDPHKEI